MKKKHLTPLEAWDDFYSKFKCDGVTPSELIVAQATRNEKQKSSTGKIKRLGYKRIQRLLDKYAPGQYQLHECSPYFTKE